MPGASSWAPNSLTLSNGQVVFPSAFQLSVTNDLVVMSSAALTLTNITSLNVGGNVLLTNNSSLAIWSAV